MNLSFAGCGFLGIYHVGVAVCFKKYAPHLLLGKISGASFGALSACCLLCDVPIGEITSDVLRVVSEARAGSLGPFSPSFNIQNALLEGMHKYLPHDVHKIVSGKLHVSLTRVYDGKNVIVSEFPTRQDLLQALLASCFVPVFSGLLPPRFHGIRYMDGGFSDNLPVLDENTITVSPFCGESDICPRDLSSQLFHVNLANTSIELSKQNMNRLARILFPPRAEVLSDMCRQGFDDALRFLHRNNLISCTRCLAVHSSYPLREPDCEQCHSHRQNALGDDLPATVMTIFQNAIEAADGGLLGWLTRRRALRCLALPCALPLDVLRATLSNYVAGRVEVHSVQYRVARCVLVSARYGSPAARLLACTPRMSRGAWRLGAGLLQQLHGFVYAAHDRSELASRVYYRLSVDDERARAASRRGSQAGVVADEGAGAGAAASLQQLLAAAHGDALLAYYYLDEHDEVRVTELYDVTEADTDAALALTPAERALNSQLQFDGDWPDPLGEPAAELDAPDDDALAERSLFSEPESEWGGDCASDSDGDRPEADRRR